MEQTQSWQSICTIGQTVRTHWQNLADKHGLSLSISGLVPLSSFSLGPDYGAETKTFITQEMLKKGYLASTTLYACVAHDTAHIEGYVDGLDDVFASIARAGSAADVRAKLEGPVCQTGFQRLN